jgi:hypothetical protein
MSSVCHSSDGVNLPVTRPALNVPSLVRVTVSAGRSESVKSGASTLSSSVNFPGASCVGGSFPSFEPLLKPSAKMASVDARTGLPEPVIPILPTSEFMSSITACESRVCLTKAFIGESR